MRLHSGTVTHCIADGDWFEACGVTDSAEQTAAVVNASSNHARRFAVTSIDNVRRDGIY